MIDREAIDAVLPETRSLAASPLALRAAEAREALYVNDVRREPHQVGPHAARSAIGGGCACSVRARRVIGVVEAQHKNSQAFAGVALKSLVSPSLAELVERNWLLESGWLSVQVRDGLRHRSDRVFLDSVIYGYWLLVVACPPDNRGLRLQELLREAIASLQPDQADPQSLRARRHHIL